MKKRRHAPWVSPTNSTAFLTPARYRVLRKEGTIRHTQQLTANRIIFRPGNPSAGVYVITEGKLSVSPEVIRLHAGDLFGESGVLKNVNAPPPEPQQPCCWQLRQSRYCHVAARAARLSALVSQMDPLRQELNTMPEHKDLAAIIDHAATIVDRRGTPQAYHRDEAKVVILII